jgi:hypothetical protein
MESSSDSANWSRLIETGQQIMMSEEDDSLHQGGVLVRPGLQAGLHHGKRLQKPTKLIAPPSLDAIGKDTRGYTFGDVHCGEDWFADGIRKGDCEHQPRQRYTCRECQHHVAGGHARSFRLHPVIEPIGCNRLHKVVEGRDGSLALSRKQERCQILGVADRRRPQENETGIRPFAKFTLSSPQCRDDTIVLDPLSNDIEILCNGGEQLFEFRNRFARSFAMLAGQHEKTRFV